MDAAFQRHDVRNGCAEKVVYVNTVTIELRHSGEGRKPSYPVQPFLDAVLQRHDDFVTALMKRLPL